MEPKFDITQFIHKIESLIEKKSAFEAKEILLNQIITLANKLQFIEGNLESMSQALLTKDSLIAEYQKVIKESTIKFTQLQAMNHKMIQQRNEYQAENDTFLLSLNEIREEVDQIEHNFNQTLTEKTNQITALNNQIDKIILEKNELIQTVNEYHQISEKEKEDLNGKIMLLLKENDYYKIKGDPQKTCMVYQSIHSEGINEDYHY